VSRTSSGSCPSFTEATTLGCREPPPAHARPLLKQLHSVSRTSSGSCPSFTEATTLGCPDKIATRTKCHKRVNIIRTKALLGDHIFSKYIVFTHVLHFYMNWQRKVFHNMRPVWYVCSWLSAILSCAVSVRQYFVGLWQLLKLEHSNKCISYKLKTSVNVG